MSSDDGSSSGGGAYALVTPEPLAVGVPALVPYSGFLYKPQAAGKSTFEGFVTISPEDMKIVAYSCSDFDTEEAFEEDGIPLYAPTQRCANYECCYIERHPEENDVFAALLQYEKKVPAKGKGKKQPEPEMITEVQVLKINNLNGMAFTSRKDKPETNCSVLSSIVVSEDATTCKWSPNGDLLMVVEIIDDEDDEEDEDEELPEINMNEIVYHYTPSKTGKDFSAKLTEVVRDNKMYPTFTNKHLVLLEPEDNVLEFWSSTAANDADPEHEVNLPETPIDIASTENFVFVLYAGNSIDILDANSFKNLHTVDFYATLPDEEEDDEEDGPADGQLVALEHGGRVIIGLTGIDCNSLLNFKTEDLQKMNANPDDEELDEDSDDGEEWFIAEFTEVEMPHPQLVSFFPRAFCPDKKDDNANGVVIVALDEEREEGVELMTFDVNDEGENIMPEEDEEEDEDEIIPDEPAVAKKPAGGNAFGKAPAAAPAFGKKPEGTSAFSKAPSPSGFGTTTKTSPFGSKAASPPATTNAFAPKFPAKAASPESTQKTSAFSKPTSLSSSTQASSPATPASPPPSPASPPPKKPEPVTETNTTAKTQPSPQPVVTNASADIFAQPMSPVDANDMNNQKFFVVAGAEPTTAGVTTAATTTTTTTTTSGGVPATFESVFAFPVSEGAADLIFCTAILPAATGITAPTGTTNAASSAPFNQHRGCVHGGATIPVLDAEQRQIVAKLVPELKKKYPAVNIAADPEDARVTVSPTAKNGRDVQRVMLALLQAFDGEEVTLSSNAATEKKQQEPAAKDQPKRLVATTDIARVNKDLQKVLASKKAGGTPTSPVAPAMPIAITTSASEAKKEVQPEAPKKVPTEMPQPVDTTPNKKEEKPEAAATNKNSFAQKESEGFNKKKEEEPKKSAFAPKPEQSQPPAGTQGGFARGSGASAFANAKKTQQSSGFGNQSGGSAFAVGNNGNAPKHGFGKGPAKAPAFKSAFGKK